MDHDIPIESSDYWRQRAEEARTRSEHMRDSITKALLLEIADTYERIALPAQNEPDPHRRHNVN